MHDRPDSEQIDRQPTDDDLDNWATATEQVMSNCANSQPYDDGEPVWLNGHGPLRDALETAGVPEEYFEDVAAKVRCPCCQNSFTLFEEVGLKAEAEMRFEELHAQWLMDQQYRLEEFYAHLENYPYLGLAHEVGREINDEIKQLPQCVLTDCSWYRARRINDGRQLGADQFTLPDPERVTVSEGRFNHHGKPVVYMAETAEAAVTEVLEEGESRAWVMGFRLREVGPVLNLSIREAWAEDDLTVLAVGLGYFGNLSRPVRREKGWKPEYLLPRFIADCARFHGFVGVVFRSSRNWADNLVLFGWDDQNILAEGEPKIVEVGPYKHPQGYRDPLGFWISDSDDAEPFEPIPV